MLLHLWHLLEAVCASEEGNSGAQKPRVERASVEAVGWLFPAGVEALEQSARVAGSIALAPKVCLCEEAEGVCKNSSTHYIDTSGFGSFSPLIIF